MFMILDIFGVEKDFPEQISSLPYRKKRNNKSYLKKKKETNKSHSKKRICYREHTICRIKKYRDNEGDVFRNKLRKYNKVYQI